MVSCTRVPRRGAVLGALLAGVCALALASAPAGAIQTIEYRASITQGVAGGLAAIAAGPDGNVWFTETRGRIGRITPTGDVTELSGFPSGVLRIAAGPDGAMWFPAASGIGTAQLGRIAVGDLARSAFPLRLDPEDIATSLVAGPDGALWFTAIGPYPVIGRMTTGGLVTSFRPTYTPPSLPTQIAVGPDGALWYTESGEGFDPEDGTEPSFRGVVRITTAGAVKPFRLSGHVSPQAITSGPDGALWFTTSGSLPAPRIGRLTTDGRFTFYDARAPRDLFIGSIVGGPDGNVWYTAGLGRIGRITPHGFVTVFRTPSHDAPPGDLAVGADGNLWMTDSSGGVVKVVPPRGRCVVPRLVGLRFASAAVRLHRADCTIGRVTAPPRVRRGRFVVQRQSPRRGTRLPAESAVDLTLRR